MRLSAVPFSLEVHLVNFCWLVVQMPFLVLMDVKNVHNHDFCHVGILAFYSEHIDLSGENDSTGQNPS